MQVLVRMTARLVRALARTYAKKWNFLALFVLVFVASVAGLARLDLLPEPAAVPLVEAAVDTAATPAPVAVELPVKIEIPAISLSASIANPDTTDIDALDATLLKGAARYPTGAKLGEAGNVVLFGHSSYLPVVGNQAYKTFNDIQKLKAGDQITVYSSDVAYGYVVKSVTKESVGDNKPIPLEVTGRELTLVTCNSFATKSDRFIVVADFVESHMLPQ